MLNRPGLTNAWMTTNIEPTWGLVLNHPLQYLSGRSSSFPTTDATNYSAVKMIGAPELNLGGDSGDAWCHSSSATGLEWIELTYSNPVYATEVRVRQNNAPGTIVMVEAIEPDGTHHTWWNGVDPYVPTDKRNLAWFTVRVPATSYRVSKMRISLNLDAVSGWKEIDAVQLVGTR